jgi:predicted ribosomally synthesized peptide with SipW-like signal peptide
MGRRKLLLALAGLVLLAVGTFALWSQSNQSRITRKTYDRLHEGMSRTEVETILGPPGDYRTVPTEVIADQDGIFGLFPGGDYSLPAPGKWETEIESSLIRGWWQGDEGQIIIICTPEVVYRKQFLLTTKKEKSTR